jgi:pimeloyl-ACP methyl ester carboxylesterase
MIATPEARPLRAADGADLQLTRFRGGDKGPLLVVHGAGVCSNMFTTPTPAEPFAPYLARHGWDVWLLDWRSSISLPLRQFTLDDAAQNDFPAAVRAILEETRADSLQAMVHCVGSLAFSLSRSRGLLPQVRSIVASQVALHLRVPTIMEAKVAIHVPEIGTAIGLTVLSAHKEPRHPIYQAALDAFLGLAHHECNSAVCHRITFMFGLLYQHANLSTDIHNDVALEKLFGDCNLLTYKHIAQLVRAGHAQSYDTGNGSVSDLRPEQFRIPIALVSGEHNQAFLPESTELTYQWLCQNNGIEKYQRRVTAGYGHIDNYLGARSDQETFPTYLELLEGHWAAR